MKYYHIIYNSSQRSQSGAPGLGVRTYTEGTPEEYIQLIDQNGCFTYDSGTIAQPSPKALLENGDLISDMPVTYGFLRLFAPSTGKEIYVYLRTICVGFDYPYYVKFTAARMDNFVTDAYVFEEYPGTEFSQIFYENPAEGSATFIPRSPVPSPQNEEMKTLSVGQMALLSAEDKSFKSDSLPVLGDEVVEMLLAYFEANRRKKPLLVKCDPRKAPSLMADLIRILPIQLEPNATFLTNYQAEGVKEGYKVFFINDGYRFDYESTGQFQILDLAAGKMVKTPEAELYRSEIKRCLAESDRENLDKLSTWLLSPLYATIRQNSPDVKKNMYNYTIEPSLFSLSSLTENAKELWPVMIDYLKKDSRNGALLCDLLGSSLVSEQEADDKVRLIDLFNRMADAGFPIEELAAKIKGKVSELLLVSPEYLSKALSAAGGIGALSRFVDKQTFEGKDEYLDAPEMTSWWADTYKTFYPEEARKPAQIVNRMLIDEVSTKDIESVLASLKVSEIGICKIFGTALAKHQKEVERIWPIVEKALDSIMSGKGSKELPDEETIQKLSSYVVTPLSYTRKMGKWKNLLLLWSNGKTGSVDSENASGLVDMAIQLKQPSGIELLLEKALPYLDARDTQKLVNAAKVILPDMKPEDLLQLAGKLSKKIGFIGTLKDVYGMKLKAVEKMVEKDPYFLQPEEMEAVRVKVYGKKPAKPKSDSSGKKDSWFQKILGIFKRKK